MQELKLPAYDYKIKETNGKNLIFDPIRKKYVVLTPEEWVRQHILSLLIDRLGYARALLKVEGGLTYNSLQKRSDVLAYDPQGKPYLLIECKAPEVPISQKTIHQATTYNLTHRAPFVAVSNGLQTYCFHVDFESGKTVQLQTFPEAPSAKDS
ncbi:type I restriction enzyme HsdR N-terminal domain-containing protein [Marinilongibacter aquaticus]|uniref:type I restriction enzyme HsdR N-terminal domain-containing protein n=1 Tax=Marinilongibacter aquaticus TaxID=2975157 RepID=UPI0021BD530F|nr:type I restriction enzyme HsdR N-terminal domain-containing protein [Marinilongibacter aquaticus]UBM60620.1 type I restriction enzyme HsdR N-terminal domain-containing protein [Marinilongibacter aquaticus]